MRRGSDKNCPPTVGAAEGRSTALEARANPTYGPKAEVGKHFRWVPDKTGINSQCGANDAEQTVWAWPKSGGELRAEDSQFNGKRFLNLRMWVAGPNGYKPTHKGVTIPLEAIGDLGDALSAYADANGLRAA